MSTAMCNVGFSGTVGMRRVFICDCVGLSSGSGYVSVEMSMRAREGRGRDGHVGLDRDTVSVRA